MAVFKYSADCRRICSRMALSIITREEQQQGEEVIRSEFDQPEEASCYTGEQKTEELKAKSADEWKEGKIMSICWGESKEINWKCKNI